MAERGDWLRPTVNGEVFDEKPILYFWLALGAASVLGGVDELALRLPNALAGMVSVLLLYALVLPYAGRRRAFLAGVLLATTFVVFWSARQVQMDLGFEMPSLYITQLMALAFGLEESQAGLNKNMIDPRPLLRERGVLM